MLLEYFLMFFVKKWSGKILILLNFLFGCFYSKQPQKNILQDIASIQNFTKINKKKLVVYSDAEYNFV